MSSTTESSENNQQEYQNLLEQGQYQMNQLKFKQAIQIFIKAIILFGQKAILYQLIGIAQYELNKLQEALINLQRANSLEKNEITYLYRGLIFQRLGHNKQAHDQFSLSLKIYPTGQAHYYLGVILNQQQNFQGAIFNLNNSKKYFFDQLIYYELINAKKNYNEKKKQMLHKKLSQNKFNVLIKYSQILLKLDYVKEAILYANQANQVQPKNYRTYQIYGKALIIQGKFNQAIKKFKKSLQYSKDNKIKRSLAFSWLSYSYNKKNIYQQGEKFGALSIKQNKQNCWGHNNYGYALSMQEGRNQQAQTCFQESIRLNPFNYNPYRNLAKLLRKQGQFKNAEIYDKIANTMDPRQIRNHRNITINTTRKC